MLLLLCDRKLRHFIYTRTFPQVESLRKDIEILSQNHERDVDRKDAIIQMLDRDLEEAEEQFQMALRSHLQNVDRLIDLQV